MFGMELIFVIVSYVIFTAFNLFGFIFFDEKAKNLLQKQGRENAVWLRGLCVAIWWSLMSIIHLYATWGTPLMDPAIWTTLVEYIVIGFFYWILYDYKTTFESGAVKNLE